MCCSYDPPRCDVWNGSERISECAGAHDYLLRQPLARFPFVERDPPDLDEDAEAYYRWSAQLDGADPFDAAAESGSTI